MPSEAAASSPSSAGKQFRFGCSGRQGSQNNNAFDWTLEYYPSSKALIDLDESGLFFLPLAVNTVFFWVVVLLAEAGEAIDEAAPGDGVAIPALVVVSAGWAPWGDCGIAILSPADATAAAAATDTGGGLSWPRPRLEDDDEAI